MKRLNIWLLGHSALLRGLAQELEGFGHSCTLHTECAALPANGADLLIEDGSLSLDPAMQRDLGQATQLLLQISLTLSEQASLPIPTLWVLRGGQPYLDSKVNVEHGGNGRLLHQMALLQWTETLADLIGLLARDEETRFATSALTSTQGVTYSSLLDFDALAYHHSRNETHDLSLLALAEQPLGARLAASFERFGALAALRWNSETWTYAQLRAAAEPVRQKVLQLSEAVPNPVVGLCMEKSPALFACMLGTLLAGGVYLPLEPSHPPERRRFILENSGARLVFQCQHAEPLSGVWEVAAPTQFNASEPWPDAPAWNPEAPCMVLYTSGTTGQPKGVLLSQHNLSHFTAWYAVYTGLEEAARVLHFSTLSFDSATIDLFPTWLSGATLVVANEDQRRDPALLAALIASEQVTHGFLPPALLSILPLDAVATMGCVTTGGDVCEPWIIDRLAQHCRFINLYGPTETTVLVAAREFQPGVSNRNLGSPIANSQVWILDDTGRPVLPGETGELHIIGPGVALGYINNPAQTQQRYVRLALPDGSSVRAYRTGDLGRWSDAGLELVGRKDNQVKIRGFRVEPEEIECCLRDARLYGQVAVVIAEEQRIAAYLAQPIGDAKACLESLRAYATQRLPVYMQPNVYTELARLPAAANGKVDRQALRTLPTHMETSTYKAPSTTHQRELQLIWSELLGLSPEEISTEDSFFNLGGHSIVLSKMLLMLRERFGHGVSINRFIEMPTISRLEQLLEVSTEANSILIDPMALADAARSVDIEPLPAERLGDVYKVLVTGANSFLGVHLVEALLAWGATEVTCLVRPSEEKIAQARFASALVDNALAVDMDRVRILSADFTQPRFGLSTSDYNRIDEAYGSVIHNGASVNHVLDYPAMVTSNVEPLFGLLKFCEGRSKKILNFVSTLSACSAVDKHGAALETGPVDTPPIYIRNGYNLSKWVGEHLLSRARTAGCFVNIFRPGNISFNSSTGVCQPHKNRLMLMLKGSLQLAAVPALDLNFDLMPVDFLAKVVAYQSSRYQPQAWVFNLHNPQPLSWPDYVSSFAQAGYSFDLVPIPVWQERLKEVDKDNALFGVLGFYLNGFEEDIGDVSSIHHQNTAHVIKRMGEAYPIKDHALLARGSAYLQRIHFI
jgi:amino acid adenylation domain-containing protein/thioester reductase-like protein